MVPTCELEIPRGKQRYAKNQGRSSTEQGPKGLVGGVDVRHIRVPGEVEYLRRHEEHGHVHQTCYCHGDHNVDFLKAKDAPLLSFIQSHDPMLRQRRVKVDHVRHDCRPYYPYGKQDRIASREARNKAMESDLAPVGLRHDRLNQIAECDYACGPADKDLQSAKTALSDA